MILKAYAGEIEIPSDYSQFNGKKSLLLTDPQGNIAISENIDVPRTLASVTKLYTGISALEYWGAKSRFKTRAYKKGDDLYIRGTGDPFFDIFEMKNFVTRIKMVMKTVDNIYIDTSGFAGVYKVDGQTDTRNPYDAPLGALAINFNTIALGKKKDGTIYSREDGVPLTPIAVELAEKYLNKGARDRMALEQVHGTSERYFGELLRQTLLEEGVQVKSNLHYKKLSGIGGATLIVEYHNSRTLAEVLKPMLRYSTNFIANQLFIAMAKEQFDDVSLENASYINADMLGRAAVNPVIRFKEGAGLSEQNMATAEDVVSMLDYWQEHFEFMPEYKDNIYAKTGTLTGTSTLAGFIKAPDGLWRFCIFLNKPGVKINGKIRRNIAAKLRDQILEASQAGALAQ